ncbi:MAG: PAS domain S-box protein [Candidatus Eisenbacteria bacterium]|nr:PAS domain S-box protein [Candidatus Eisenbacteria bacterium]
MSGIDIPLSEDPSIYRRSFHDSTDAIVITDLAGKIAIANQAWLSLYGYALEEVIGNSTSLVKSEQTTREMYDYMWSQISDPAKGFWRGEIVNRKRDGTEVAVLLTITPIRREGGIVGYMGLGIDVTERKEAEALRETYGMIVRHDLKAPLGSLLALLDAMLDGFTGPITEKQEEVLSRAKRSAQRMHEIIATSLDMGKLKRGILRLDIEDVDLFAAARASIETLEQLAARREARVRLCAGTRDATPEDTLVLCLDPVHLQRCVDNLLKNAIEASPEGGDVRVLIEKTANTASIRFENAGSPIPPDIRATLFHPFSAYGKRGGTGLGVYGVKMTVEAMGGSIRYESNESGTVFEIAFPIAVNPER